MPTLTGTVLDALGDPASRVVRAYRRSDGAFAGQVVSNATTGVFSVAALDSTKHFAVAHDGVEIPGDSGWDSVKVALHMDGTNGSTTITDEKGGGFAALGGAQISTAQYAPLTGNASSAHFAAANDGVKLASASALAFGTGDFSISAWIFLEAYATITSGGQYRSAIAGKTASDDEWELILVGTSSSFTELQFRARQTPYGEPSVSHTFLLNTWYNLEVTRISGKIYFFVNGVLKNAGGTAFAQAITASASGLVIGRGEYSGYLQQLYGFVDDFQMSIGAGRHIAGFSVPTTPFFNNLPSIGAPTENAVIYDYITPA